MLPNLLHSHLVLQLSKRAKAATALAFLIMVLSAALPAGAQTAGCTTPGFSAPVSYPVGDNPEFIATGDFEDYLSAVQACSYSISIRPDKDVIAR